MSESGESSNPIHPQPDRSATEDADSREPGSLDVGDDDVGKRLDAVLSRHSPTISRVRWRRAITAGRVQVNGRGSKASYKLRDGDRIEFSLPEPTADAPLAEDIPLDVIFEDEQLAAINKPPGMVVHPAKGHWSGTLTSALAFRFANLSNVGGASRPGIVHRLDRDTSGVIVVAKTDEAHLGLARQFEQRTTKKTYAAIVAGCPDRDRDVIDAPIGPHPYQREKMAIRRNHDAAREAETFYEVKERFRGFAFLELTPKTGRTHQIRIHLGHIGSPVLCDKLYGGRAQITRGELCRSDADDIVLSRQALHACRLEINHPLTGSPLTFTAPLPADIAATLEILRRHRKLN